MTDPPHDRPLFVCQVKRGGQTGPVAPWITMASWANAAAELHAGAIVLTTEGPFEPRQALERAARSRPVTPPSARRRRIPEPAVTIAKDLRRIAENRSFTRGLLAQGWSPHDVPYVFQLHGLFWDAGLRLARAIGRPSVLVVDACQVEEARTWGIRRRGYGGVAERYGEAPQLGAADLVVCVSDEVADQVRRVVGRTDGVVVVPNGVDTHLFAPGAPDPGLRASLGIGEGSFVVGWTGSFRSFHGIDALIEAVARLRERLPNAVLLLVGDGLGRPAVETRARDLGVKAVFTGTVPYPSVPSFLRTMDVTVALAPSRSFHYSPVKIREYQACERPVIAAAAGEMARDFADTALLVEPGDVGSLADALALVHDDPVDAGTRARAGRDSVVEHGSWIARLREVERALGIEERG